MFAKLCNFFSTFKNPVCVILGIIGAIAGGCSFIPVLPMWANIVLKVIGIGAPVIGLLIGIIKFFKNRKKTIAPVSLVERALTADTTLDEAEIEEYLENSYQDVVEESVGHAKKDSKVYDAMDDELVDENDSKVEAVEVKKNSKKRIKKAAHKSNFNDNLRGLDPDFRVPVYNCMEEILAN